MRFLPSVSSFLVPKMVDVDDPVLKFECKEVDPL